MNKKELIEALKKYPDDTEIRVWAWTKKGSKYYLTNPTLTNNPNVRTDCFDLAMACEVSDLMAEVKNPTTIQVEFKIDRRGVCWENIHIYDAKNFRVDGSEEEAANLHARWLSRLWKAQVRWNYENCLQGHYVTALQK